MSVSIESVKKGGDLLLYDLRSPVGDKRPLMHGMKLYRDSKSHASSVPAEGGWVSIDGLSDTNDRLRGRIFEKTVTTIQSSAHPKTYAHITISSLRCREVAELKKRSSVR